MHDWRSLSHVRWEYKYHVVIIATVAAESRVAAEARASRPLPTQALDTWSTDPVAKCRVFARASRLRGVYAVAGCISVLDASALVWTL